MKITSRRGTAGCGRQLDEDQQKRECASTGIDSRGRNLEICNLRIPSDRVTGAWKQISKQRRRVDVSYAPSMVTALQHGTWMHDESFKKTCIKEKEKG